MRRQTEIAARRDVISLQGYSVKSRAGDRIWEVDADCQIRQGSHLKRNRIAQRGRARWDGHRRLPAERERPIAARCDA